MSSSLSIEEPKTGKKTTMQRVTIKCFLRHCILLITMRWFFGLFSYKATRWCLHQIIDKQINIRLGACTQGDIYLIRYRSSRPCRRVFLARKILARLSQSDFLSRRPFSFFAKGSNDYCLRNFPLHREKEKK